MRRIDADHRAVEVAQRLEVGERGGGLGAGQTERGGDRVAGLGAELERLEHGMLGVVELRAGPLDPPHPGAEHRVEHVLGVADEAGAAGEQVVGGDREARADRAGDGAEIAAQVRRQVGGDQRARALRRLDDDGHPRERGHDPVAGREAPAPGAAAGRQLGEHQALLADPPPQRAVRRRIGDVGAAAEHRDGQAAVERPAVRAGVDPEGKATDDDQPGARQLAPQLARDLAAVGAGAAGADHRHRLVGGEPQQQRRVPPADQRPGGVGGVAQAGRVERVVMADGPARRSLQVLVQPSLGHGGEPGEHLPAVPGRHRVDQVRVAEPQQLGRASPRRAGGDLLDVGGEVGEQARAAQALRAGLGVDLANQRVLLRSWPRRARSRRPEEHAAGVPGSGCGAAPVGCRRE